MPQIETTEQIRKAAETLINCIADAQSKLPEDSWAFKNLQKDYDAISAYQEKVVEVADWRLA